MKLTPLIESYTKALIKQMKNNREEFYSKGKHIYDSLSNTRRDNYETSHEAFQAADELNKKYKLGKYYPTKLKIGNVGDIIHMKSNAVCRYMGYSIDLKRYQFRSLDSNVPDDDWDMSIPEEKIKLYTNIKLLIY